MKHTSHFPLKISGIRRFLHRNRNKILLLAAFALPLLSGCGKDSENTLTILNYGKYLEPEAIKMFEEETGIKVEYEEYITPENMYTKYRAGATDTWIPTILIFQNPLTRKTNIPFPIFSEQ